MGLATLGYALAGTGALGQGIAVEHGHGLEVIGEDPGRGEAGHARTDDDGVAMEGAGHPAFLSRWLRSGTQRAQDRFRIPL